MKSHLIPVSMAKLLGTVCVLGCLSALQATPVAVPVKIWVEAAVSNGYVELNGDFLETAPGADDGALSTRVPESGNSTGTLTAVLESARMEPGRAYQVTVSGLGLTASQFNVTPPPGFYVEIENFVRQSHAMLTPYGTVMVRILPRPAPPPRLASSDVNQATGKIDWHVALGSLRNGTSAGELALIDAGFISDWGVYYTPAMLDYEPVSDEVSVHRSGGWIRQIIANETMVDVVTNAEDTTVPVSTYEIRFYNPTQRRGTAFPYTFSGQPYTVYQIKQQGTTANSLQFTRKSYEVPDDTTTGLSPELTEVMTIVRTGTAWPAYTWTHTPWHKENTTPLTQRTVTGASATGGRTELAVVQVPGGAAVTQGARTFATTGWGEALMAETLGSTQAREFVYDFYDDQTASPGSYSFIKSRRANLTSGGGHGDWEAYEYYDDDMATSYRAGTVKHRFRPFKDDPATISFAQGSGEFTSYEYSPDPFGYQTRPSRVETRIGGILTAKSTTTYTNATVNNLTVVTATRHDYSDANHFLETITRYYAEDTADRFFRNQLYSVTQPDGVKVSYAYQLGTYNPSTKAFVAGATPTTASRIAVITGTTQATGNDSCLTYDGFIIDNLYLVRGKSTLEVTIRNERALVCRTETYVWTDSSAWQLVASTDLGYTFTGRLQTRTSSNGAEYSATYLGRLLESETDASGIMVAYTYDDALRLETATKAGGPTTVYEHDAAGRIVRQSITDLGTTEEIVTQTAYDTAGRLTGTTPPGLGTTTVSYDVGARTRTTQTPSGAQTIETYHLDGRPKQTVGSGTVDKHYTHSVEGDGRRLTAVHIGDGGSPRWEKTWTDWLGRTIMTQRPGFSKHTPQVLETQYYHHENTGRLDKVANSGLEPTRYEYDDLGSVVSSGLDVGDDGLDPDSADRISDTNTKVDSYEGAWWITTETKTYPYTGASAATPVRTSLTRVRLTGFTGGVQSETQSTDAEGNLTTVTATVYRGNQTVVTTTARTGFATAATQTAVNGLVTSVIGHDGLETTLAYDELSRLEQSTDSRDNTLTTAYKPGTTLVAEITDALDHVISGTTYNTSGQQSSRYDDDGHATHFTYNLRGQLEKQWGGASHPVLYGYDATYGDLTALTTYRNAVGWDGTTWPTNPGDEDVTTFHVDPASGLLWKKEDASEEGHCVEYDYNVRGQVRTRTLARNLTTTYTYYGDGTGEAKTGELHVVDYPGTDTPDVTYAYTRSGQVESVDDGTGTRDFVYDPDKPWRLVSEALDEFYGNRVITRLYADTGVLGRYRGFRLGDTAGGYELLEQTYTYTDAGRFDTLQTQRNNNQVSRLFTYGYEPDAALLHSLTTGSGANTFTVTRGYEDERNLLTRIETTWDSASRTCYDYTYNNLARRATRKQSGDVYGDYGEPVYQRFAYNSRGELTAAPWYLGSNVESTASPLQGRFYQYDYDTAGNRRWANRTGLTTLREDYTTNALNQYDDKENHALGVSGTVGAATTNVAVAGGSGTTGRQGRYWSDEVFVDNAEQPWRGEVTTYAARPGDGDSGEDLIRTSTRTAQLLASLQSFTYDPDGNLVSDGLWDYTHDAENRLITMETTDDAVTLAGFTHRVITFHYDYLGRRVAKREVMLDGLLQETEVSHRRYLYDGWNLIAEFKWDSSTSTFDLNRSYTWGLDLTGSLTAAGGVGALVQIYDYAATKELLPAYDGHGNVAALLNADDGTAEAIYEYSPYGELLRKEGAYAAINPFRFSTKYTDEETGLVYYGHRYYSPDLGRFINRDPIEEQGGINLYSFVRNNAINAWDYLGMADGEGWQYTSYQNANGEWVTYIDWGAGASGWEIEQAKIAAAANIGWMTYAEQAGAAAFAAAADYQLGQGNLSWVAMYAIWNGEAPKGQTVFISEADGSTSVYVLNGEETDIKQALAQGNASFTLSSGESASITSAGNGSSFHYAVASNTAGGYGAPANDCAITTIQVIQKAYNLKPDSRETIIKNLDLPASHFDDSDTRYKGLKDNYNNRSTTELLNAALNPSNIYVDHVPQDFGLADLVAKGNPLILGGHIGFEGHMVAAIPTGTGTIIIYNITGTGGARERATYSPADAIKAGFPYTGGTTPPVSGQMWYTYQGE